MGRLAFYVFAVAVCLVLLPPITVDASGVIQFLMICYSNNSGRRWDGKACDPINSYKCDPKFTFYMDGSGLSFPTRGESGHYQDNNSPCFGSHVGGIPNPIVWTFSRWPGTMRFGVYIRDNDLNYHDEIDRLEVYLDPLPDGVWKDYTLQGRTSMSMRYIMYCDTNYYSRDCSVYCLASDTDVDGHYTCDPATGDTVCRPGWKDESSLCRTSVDECFENEACLNGGECIDGHMSYTCMCTTKYTGQFCENLIQDEVERRRLSDVFAEELKPAELEYF